LILDASPMLTFAAFAKSCTLHRRSGLSSSTRTMRLDFVAKSRSAGRVSGRRFGRPSTCRHRPGPTKCALPAAIDVADAMVAADLRHSGGDIRSGQHRQGVATVSSGHGGQGRQGGDHLPGMDLFLRFDQKPQSSMALEQFDLEHLIQPREGIRSGPLGRPGSTRNSPEEAPSSSNQPTSCLRVGDGMASLTGSFTLW
jgi:hypothetical protein